MAMDAKGQSLEDIHKRTIARLVPFANGLAARYGGPVYLVGSALTTFTPRDYDVRVLMCDEDFVVHFGKVGDLWILDDKDDMAHWGPTHWKKCSAELKQSRHLSRLCDANVDVKFIHPNHKSHYLIEGQYRRLDEAEDSFFESGLKKAKEEGPKPLSSDQPTDGTPPTGAP